MDAIVSDITEQGFTLHVYGRVYDIDAVYDKTFNVSRDLFAWFLGATDDELKDVTAFPGDIDDDEHGHCLHWEKLDVTLGHLDFEHPEERSVYHAAHTERERYYKSKK
jgi:hypothetical protein